ncbi:MAG: bifunctional oligoribonuclease/PAP phosphatase NrnA [Candidatus Omnitrophica bacterium]|nr:bifunctional oligoribonuclease/PAP phosphatase NrnA [Candidatus Omnitrophota bacterium]
METIEKITKVLKKYDKFLITSHINPEGDSLGSQLAMAELLKCLGKKFVIFDNDKVPERYRFLPGINLIRNDIKDENEKFDAAIVLDCPNLKRVGRVREAVKKTETVINIDHHVSNEKFGDLNWVEEGASSAGEMVYKLYKSLNCKITKTVALYLYIAILTDTGSFNYSNTSGATHEIISELLGYGIEPYDVSQSIYENKTLGEVKLLAKALSDLKVLASGKVACLVVRKDLFRKTKTKPTACENFVNFARSVKGVNVAVFFREDINKKNVFHVSFRSTGRVDVNRIASFFGGGGHKNAAGCNVRGSLNEVKKKVLEKVKDAL